MYILGINAYHGDASAAILCDGELIAAVEEERFRRIKHIAGFPEMAVKYCLDAAGIRPEELDHVAISRNRNAHFHNKVLFTLSQRPSFRLLKNRLANAVKLGGLKEALAKALDLEPQSIKAKAHHVEHHRSHLASSFFVSPFEESTLLSVDGFGDFVSTMWGSGRDRTITVRDWVPFPHSLGILYTACTQYLGFSHYGDEYKVMGLASYGEPVYAEQFERLVTSKDSKPHFRLNLPYFVHHREGADMTWDAGSPEMGPVYSNEWARIWGPPRQPDDPIEKRHQDIAASLQAVLEARLFHLLNRLHDATRTKALCMAGGVALNCVANGKIFSHTPFEQLYIQPAAGDAGTSLGAALYVYHHVLQQPRSFVMNHAYWGPDYTNDVIHAVLENAQSELANRNRRIEHIPDPDRLCRTTAQHIADGCVVGWFQGKMEFGPRALGNRSIVVDPRRPEMKDVLNKRIKHRETFRPFAPSILEESVGDYFSQSHPSPFMLMTCDVKTEKQKLIPASTHVDGTGRLQTVNRSENPLYWQLIKSFEQLTGVPVLVNTSFNDNEPIVCQPREALDCFLRTKMDVLVLGEYLIR